MICFIIGQVIERGSGLPGTGRPDRLVSISSMVTTQGHFNSYWACNNPHSRTIHTITGRNGEFVLPFCIEDGTEHEWIDGRFSVTVFGDRDGRGARIVARGQTRLATDIMRLLAAVGITSTDAGEAILSMVDGSIQTQQRSVLTERIPIAREIRGASGPARGARPAAGNPVPGRAAVPRGGARGVRGAGMAGASLHSARMHRPYGALKIIC